MGGKAGSENPIEDPRKLILCDFKIYQKLPSPIKKRE